jgi:hypothetical protein
VAEKKSSDVHTDQRRLQHGKPKIIQTPVKTIKPSKRK